MKDGLRLFAAAAALSLAASALPAHAAPAPQDGDDHRSSENREHPDYSNNSYYQTGNREGYQDYQKKQQRKEHNHRFRSDDDRAAHDYGYQQGWTGQRGYNNGNTGRNNSNGYNTDRNNSNRYSNSERNSANVYNNTDRNNSHGYNRTNNGSNTNDRRGDGSYNPH